MQCIVIRGSERKRTQFPLAHRSSDNSSPKNRFECKRGLEFRVMFLDLLFHQMLNSLCFQTVGCILKTNLQKAKKSIERNELSFNTNITNDKWTSVEPWTVIFVNLHLVNLGKMLSILKKRKREKGRHRLLNGLMYRLSDS